MAIEYLVAMGHITKIPIAFDLASKERTERIKYISSIYLM